MRLLFAVLMLTSLAFASNACDAKSITDIWNNWASLSSVMLVVSFLLTVIIYMLGKLSEDAMLLASVKSNLSKILMTAIILAVVWGVVSSICAFDGRAIGLSKQSVFEEASAYFDHAASQTEAAYAALLNANMLIAGASSIRVNSAAIPMGLLIQLSVMLYPYAGMSIALSALNFASNFMMVSIALTSAYAGILSAIQTVFLNLLLPVGVLLRCFTPTREFGGSIMALAIGLFLFFPLLFSVAYLVIGEPGLVGMPDMDWEGKIYGQFAIFSTTSLSYMGTLATLPTQMYTMKDMSGDKIGIAIGLVGESILTVYVLPALLWVILVALVRNLSKTLGEELDISSLSRLI